MQIVAQISKVRGRGIYRSFPMSKRMFDICFVLITAPVTLVVALVLSIVLLIVQGRPILYFAPRCGYLGRQFSAFKFRTMRPGAGSDTGVTGGQKQARVTALGAVLRRTRLDELPQLLNVLFGQMSMVGPRPPDPRYVALHPDIYHEVLQLRPGLTGLATLLMHSHEARILSDCTTPEETEQVYLRRCVPRKARLDRQYYAQLRVRSVFWLDFWLLCQSFMAVLGLRR